jgi:hypothetical protein
MPNRAIQAGLQPCCRISMLLGDFAVWITRRKQISREPFTSFEVIFPLIAGVVQAEYPNSLRNGPIFWPELRTVSFLLPSLHTSQNPLSRPLFRSGEPRRRNFGDFAPPETGY